MSNCGGPFRIRTELMRTVNELPAGLTFDRVGNRVSIYFPSDREAEKFMRALEDADQKGSYVKIDFSPRT